MTTDFVGGRHGLAHPLRGPELSSIKRAQHVKFIGSSRTYYRSLHLVRSSRNATTSTAEMMTDTIREATKDWRDFPWELAAASGGASMAWPTLGGAVAADVMGV